MPNNTLPAVYISVDVETAGPNPSLYSLLTIGAVAVGRPQHSFYVELRPVNNNFVAEALRVSRLSLEQLSRHGLDPAEAMRRFEAWLKNEAAGKQRPVFVAFNAPFDWMFVNDYFYRFLGRNPFGHSALDIKAFYLGVARVAWDESSMKAISERYLGDRQNTHHALRDAMDQAEIFLKLLDETGIEHG
jgi:DNA polymerase III epsilon subunit-like protein